LLTTKLNLLEINKPKLSEVRAVTKAIVNNMAKRNHSRGWLDIKYTMDRYITARMNMDGSFDEIIAA